LKEEIFFEISSFFDIIFLLKNVKCYKYALERIL